MPEQQRASEPMLSAGTLLRQARMAQGLHIAALAAQIKVSPRKLEALESDRFDELLDPTFTRALANTVCRQLKIDPQPVLARLPQPKAHRLEHAAHGIDRPFRDRPGRQAADEPSPLTRPVVWGPALILLAALLVYAVPERWVERVTAGSATPEAAAPPAAGVAAVPAPAAAAASVATPAAAGPAAVVETVHSSTTASDAMQSAIAPTEPTAGALVLRASGESWIEVRDARGQALLSRTVQRGETVGLDGAPPLKLRIGNAAATQVSFRGQPVDLSGVTRDNIARLELK